MDTLPPVCGECLASSDTIKNESPICPSERDPIQVLFASIKRRKKNSTPSRFQGNTGPLYQGERCIVQSESNQYSVHLNYIN